MTFSYMSERNAKKIWTIGTVILIFSILALGFSTTILEKKIVNARFDLEDSESLIRIRLGQNYQEYLDANTIANIWKSSYLILEENNASVESLAIAEKIFLDYKMLALGNWYIITTGNLPSETEIDSWKSLNEIQIIELEKEFKDKRNIDNLWERNKENKEKVIYYEDWKTRTTLIIICLQIVGLILISYSEVKKR